MELYQSLLIIKVYILRLLKSIDRLILIRLKEKKKKKKQHGLNTIPK